MLYPQAQRKDFIISYILFKYLYLIQNICMMHKVAILHYIFYTEILGAEFVPPPIMSRQCSSFFCNITHFYIVKQSI